MPSLRRARAQHARRRQLSSAVNRGVASSNPPAYARRRGPESGGLPPLLGLLGVIVGCTAIVGHWFEPMLPLGGGEQGIPFIRPDVMVRWAWWLWSDSRVGGVFPTLSSGAPFWVSVAALWKLSVPAWALQALVFWLCLATAGISVFYLARDHLRGSLVGPLMAVVIYLTGPFAAVNVWHRFLLTHLLMLAYLPASLALMRRAYVRNSLGPILALLLITPWFAAAFATPGFIAVFWMCVLLDGLSMRPWMPRGTVGPKLLLAGFGWMAVNAYWIWPLFDAGGAVMSGAAGPDSLVTLRGVSHYLDLPYVMRGLNRFVLEETRSLRSFYQLRPFLIALFLLPLLAVLALARKSRGDVTNLGFLWVVGLFLMKGTSRPGGEILAHAISAHPLLGVFRNPYERLGFVYHLPLAILVAVGASSLGTRPLMRQLTVSGMALVVLLIGWPVVSGEVFQSLEWGTYRVRVPESYTRLEAWLRDHETLRGERLLVAPVTSEGVSYLWDPGYRGVDVMPALVPSSISMLSGTIVSPQLREGLALFPVGPSSEAVARLLGARFVAVRHDIDPTPDPVLSPDAVNSALRKSGSYEVAGNLGNLTLYRIQGCVYPRLYATGSARIVRHPTFEQLASAASRGCETIVGPEQQDRRPLPAEEGTVTTDGPTHVPFRRISPTSYVADLPVEFTGWVVLNEAWDSRWTATRLRGEPKCPLVLSMCLGIAGDEVAGVGEPQLVNSYANGWWINSWEGGSLILHFKPQRRVEVGALVAVLGLLVVGAAAWIFRQAPVRERASPDRGRSG